HYRTRRCRRRAVCTLDQGSRLRPFRSPLGSVPMRVTLIHNPDAGDGDRLTADALVAQVRRAGHQVVYQSVKEENWHTVLEKPADLVAVAGGDGTVRKAVCHIKRPLPIALLPSGTANNISKTLGLADIPLQELIEGWAAGQCLKFDVPLVDSPWGQEIFIEALGIGLFAQVMAGHENKNSRDLEDIWKAFLEGY